MTGSPSPKWLVILMVLVTVTGCDSGVNSRDETVYVVESVLIAGRPLPRLLLTRIGGIEEQYNGADLSEEGAQVTVRVVGPGLDEVIRYQDAGAGYYRPGNPNHRVLSLHRYELTVQPAGAHTSITAMTVVPDTFRHLIVDLGTVEHENGDPPLLHFTSSSYPEHDQNNYIVVTEALIPTPSALVPHARDLYEEYEIALESLAYSSSPVFTEESCDVAANGTLTLRYWWSDINFYGINLIHINALDNNVLDFARSYGIQQQLGIGTLVPGEMHNIQSNIQGAHGLFGSIAQATAYVNVTSP